MALNPGIFHLCRASWIAGVKNHWKEMVLDPFSGSFKKPQGTHLQNHYLAY